MQALSRGPTIQKNYHKRQNAEINFLNKNPWAIENAETWKQVDTPDIRKTHASEISDI